MIDLIGKFSFVLCIIVIISDYLVLKDISADDMILYECFNSC